MFHEILKRVSTAVRECGRGCTGNTAAALCCHESDVAGASCTLAPAAGPAGVAARGCRGGPHEAAAAVRSLSSPWRRTHSYDACD